ncbi:MAG: CHAT domain-containing tetratricopeptide repeat protein [Cyanobacteria bacterium P01_A01_bin.68]
MYLQKLRFITLLSLVATLSGAAVPNLAVELKASQVLAQTVDEREVQAVRLLKQGSEQLKTGEYETAIQSSQQALVIYREIKNRQGEVLALKLINLAYLSLGNYALKTGEYETAIESFQQVLIFYREIKDQQGEGMALHGISLAYLSLGNYTKAIDYSEQHLAIAREIKDRKSEGAALGNLGLAYLSLGDYAKAINSQQQRLAIAREIKDHESEGAALGNLGIAYRKLGDYAKAIDYEQQKLAVLREIKDRNSEGKALGNIGAAYLSLGDYAKAIDYLEQHLAIAREIKNRQGEGTAIGNLGVAYRNLGDYAKAIDYSEQYLAIAREIKNRQGEGMALGNLGIAYRNLGDYAKAIDYFEQHLVIAREIKDRNSEGKALGNLGLAYYSLGDYAKAIDYSEQLLVIAREIKDRKDEGSALGNLGIAYLELGDYAKAIDYSEQYLAIAREIKDRSSEGTALNNLGLAFYKSGNLSAAETTLFEGIRVNESLRRGLNDANKVSIFDTQSNTYRILQKVLIAQNKTDTALEIAERGRARAFVELLSSRLNIKEKPQAPKIEQIKQIAKAQNATLVQYSIIYDELKVAGKVQTKESELYIWVVKPTGEVTFRKADLKPLWQKENTNLAELVINSRESIGARGRGIDVSYNPDAGKAQNNLKRLHELLIKPIADVLPKNSSARVIFIPQSSLFLAPFPALRDENGQYLIEKHTILTSPSIQVLNLTRKQRNNTGTENLIVGNPQMPKVPPKIGEPPQQLPPLPGAETEAKAIASLLNTKPLIGSQATESEVVKRLPQARIIHLATHGIFNDVQGLNSGIALTASGKDDGLLTAGEIFDLKLNADLVVLSACDTGRGKITGDGVVGLSRSFISAGVPSVLVSLWSVPDAPTASLMTEFYQNLSKNPDKATALRQAMLTTMKQHPAPKDWAAFTLIGEAD